VEEESRFVGNSAAETGGAFHLALKSHILVKNSIFEFNSGGSYQLKKDDKQ
jgi:hypothetical protein